MDLRVKSIISVAIAAMLYALVGKGPESIHTECQRRILVLGPGNESELDAGNWIILTPRSRLSTLDLSSRDYSIALLVVDSLENAKIAARLGMKNAEGAVLINELLLDRKHLKRTVALQEALDYAIYYRVLALRSSIESGKPLEPTTEKGMLIIFGLAADMVISTWL